MWIPALLAGLFAASAAAAPLDPLAHVDPTIRTGGHGHTFPGPSLPFGMVQLGPDTRLDGWDGCSGYHHSDDRIFGFSHTHLSGTGASDYGDILLLPATPGMPRPGPRRGRRRTRSIRMPAAQCAGHTIRFAVEDMRPRDGGRQLRSGARVTWG